jgi:hypothetical protein
LNFWQKSHGIFGIFGTFGTVERHRRTEVVPSGDQNLHTIFAYVTRPLPPSSHLLQQEFADWLGLDHLIMSSSNPRSKGQCQKYQGEKVMANMVKGMVLLAFLALLALLAQVATPLTVTRHGWAIAHRGATKFWIADLFTSMLAILRSCSLQSMPTES